MACASASELDRRVATGLATASLLPELQNLRTSMPLFEGLLRLGSNGLFFSGSGEPAKRSFSRMILLRAEPESSACFRSHAENETMCSIRCDAHPPRRLRRDRRPPRPNRLHAAAGRLSSALVRVVSTVSGFCHRFALEAVDWIREVKAKIAVAESLAAEAPCLVRLALPRNARRRGFAPTLQMRFPSQPDQEWPYRLRASIHADAASHVFALAYWSPHRRRVSFLFL